MTSLQFIILLFVIGALLAPNLPDPPRERRPPASIGVKLFLVGAFLSPFVVAAFVAWCWFNGDAARTLFGYCVLAMIPAGAIIEAPRFFRWLRGSKK